MSAPKNKKPIDKAQIKALMKELLDLNNKIKEINSIAYETSAQKSEDTNPKKPKLILTKKNAQEGIAKDVTNDQELILKFFCYSDKLVENISWLKRLINQILWTQYYSSAKVDEPEKIQARTFIDPPPQDPPGGTWP